jgi:hypothetical protein
LEKFARDKHVSLLEAFVNHGRNVRPKPQQFTPKPGAYLEVEHFKESGRYMFFSQTFTKLEMLARDKHSSALSKFVS